MAIARWGLKVKVIGQGQRSMQKECATRVSTSGSREYRLMVVLVGFHCDVISCELALLGVDGLWMAGGQKYFRNVFLPTLLVFTARGLSARVLRRRRCRRRRRYRCGVPLTSSC